MTPILLLEYIVAGGAGISASVLLIALSVSVALMIVGVATSGRRTR